MKQKLLALSMLVVMLSLASLPKVSAYQVYEWGEISSDNYTVDWLNADGHRKSLEDRKLYHKSPVSFGDGLMQVIDGTGERTTTNYVNTDGEYVDLNRGRYDFMSRFENGWASANGMIMNGCSDDFYGFIDKNGNVVLDLTACGSCFHYGEILTSRFVDGKTIVASGPINGVYSLSNIEQILSNEEFAKNMNYVKKLPDKLLPVPEWDKDTAYSGYFFVIDKQGNVLESMYGIKAVMEHPLFYSAICNYDGVPLGVLMDPMAYAGYNTSPSENEVVVPTEPEIVYPDEYVCPDYTDYKEAQTHFQSKGKIKEVVLGDMSLCSFMLEVTNDTDYTDSGVIAVALSNLDNSTSNLLGSIVVFSDYYLAPHTSSVIGISTRDIAHMYMFGEHCLDFRARMSAEALNGMVGASVIHFENDEDLAEFEDLVPYEQSWQSSNFSNERQPVCVGEPGKEFLKMLSIDRPYSSTEGNHEFCRR